jgi:hypothetical protein
LVVGDKGTKQLSATSDGTTVCHRDFCVRDAPRNGRGLTLLDLARGMISVGAAEAGTSDRRGSDIGRTSRPGSRPHAGSMCRGTISAVTKRPSHHSPLEPPDRTRHFIGEHRALGA